MATVMTRATLGDKFINGLSAELIEVIDQADKDYSLVSDSAHGIAGNGSTLLFKTAYDNKNARGTIGGLGQLGDLQLTNEGEDYKSDVYASGYETQFDYEKYTSRVEITEEDRDDSKVAARLMDTARLYTAAKRTANKQMFGVLNYGWTAQASLPAFLTFYGDAVPFFSASHPLKNATGATTTDGNTSTGAFSETNFETCRVMLLETLGDRAELLGYGSGNIILVVPHTLEAAAARFAKGEKRAGTTNNDINVYDGIVTVMSTKWVSAASGGSDTAYFLVDSMNSPLRYIVRRPISVSAPWTKDSNKNICIDVSARWKIGNSDWRGVVGSTGV